jgi:hypothetical protein
VSYAVIGVAALAGPILMLIASRYGVHVTPDSFTYLGTASSLAHGAGWTYPFNDPGAPVTLFPPLFPLALAVGHVFGVDPLHWALWGGVVTFWLLLAIAGVGVYWNTDRSLVPALAGMAFGVLGLPTLLVYSNVWSETLFFPMVVLALFLLGGYLSTRATRYLVLAGAATSVAFLTRYMGLSLVLTGCLLLAVWPGRRLLERARVVGVYLAISVAANVVWALRNLIETGTLTGNNHLVHQLTAAQVADGLRVVALWFFVRGPLGPWGLGLVVLLGLAVAVGFTLLVVLSRGRRGAIHLPASVGVLLAYPAVHFLFILAANAFSSRSPPFNDRMLGPMYMPLALGIVILGHAAWRAAGGVSVTERTVVRTILAAGLASLLVIVGVGARTSVSNLTMYKKSAQALTGISTWLQGQAGGASGAVAYGNPANVAWFATGLPVTSLPKACFGKVNVEPSTYQQQLDDLGTKLEGRPRLVVVFTGHEAGFGGRKCKGFSLPQLQTSLDVAVKGQRGNLVVLQGG